MGSNLRRWSDLRNLPINFWLKGLKALCGSSHKTMSFIKLSTLRAGRAFIRLTASSASCGPVGALDLSGVSCANRPLCYLEVA